MDSTNTDKQDVVNTAKLSFAWDKESCLVISIVGALTVHSVSSVWNKVMDLQKKSSPQNLIFDAKDLVYVDSIGAVLLLTLKDNQHKNNNKFVIKNVNSEVEKILTFLEAKKRAVVTIQPTLIFSTDFFSSIGRSVTNVIKDVGDNITFLGHLIVYFLQIIIHPARIRYQDFWRAMEDIGPKALPIVFLIGFLVGIIITFQSAEPFSRFDAQIYIVDLVGLGLVREMGPLMTAILLAGRTASAFAAEIGSMKINQEIDALSTMGIDAIRFLAVPRILAAIIMTPLLSMFLIVSGMFGCFLIMLSLGYNSHIIIKELYEIVSLSDFFAGLVKTFVFGAIIASVGCLHGVKTTIGASAVGLATTRAVVSSLIMLTVVDGIFAVVYYALGI
jgi:phospholipid/cholesterol/gamma-HCH transport system permease protein